MYPDLRVSIRCFSVRKDASTIVSPTQVASRGVTSQSIAREIMENARTVHAACKVESRSICRSVELAADVLCLVLYYLNTWYLVRGMNQRPSSIGAGSLLGLHNVQSRVGDKTTEVSSSSPKRDCGPMKNIYQWYQIPDTMVPDTRYIPGS